MIGFILFSSLYFPLSAFVFRRAPTKNEEGIMDKDAGYARPRVDRISPARIAPASIASARS
jgi:hypothetical protein